MDSSKTHKPSIPVSEPLLSVNTIKYVTDAIQSGWISSSGKYIQKFESQFADFIDVRYATTVSNGTAALHLALASLGVGPGDEVIVPNLTIISCALAVTYLGATPVFVDVSPHTGNIDPEKIAEKISARTKAIMIVHLFGHPCEMTAIMKLAAKNKIPILEDAAEAHGALYRGKMVGSFGSVAAFSFYANKIITTGEGGMIVSNSKKIITTANSLKNLAHHPSKRFFHNKVGFNYRFTNLQAAVGVAQLESVTDNIMRKRNIAALYTKVLSKVPFIETPIESPEVKSVFWMYAVKIAKNASFKRNDVVSLLKKHGVETRNFFYPLDKQPALKKFKKSNEHFPVSHDLSARGFYLPTGLTITDEEICRVSSILENVIQQLSARKLA